MRRGQGLPLNTVIVAIIVIVVLVVVVLIFTSQSGSFNDTLKGYRCTSASDCPGIGSSFQAQQQASAPMTLKPGQPAVFSLPNPDGTYTQLQAQVDYQGPNAPSPTAKAIAERAGGPTGDLFMQGTPSVPNLTTEYTHTQREGTYAYTLIATTKNGSRVETGNGTFVVTSSSGTAPDTAEPISLSVSRDVRWDTDIAAVAIVPARFDAGELVFSNGSNRIAIQLQPRQPDGSASDPMRATLIGDAKPPFVPGTYAFDRSASYFETTGGDRVPLDASVALAPITVSDSTSCTGVSTCPAAMPYCVSDGAQYACSSTCAGIGQKAASPSSCCTDLTYSSASGTCEVPSGAATIAVIPVHASDSQVASFVASFKPEFLAQSPARECSKSTLRIETISAADAASCLSSCPLETKDGVSNAQFQNCENTVQACGEKLAPDADRIIGLVGYQNISVLLPFNGKTIAEGFYGISNGIPSSSVLVTLSKMSPPAETAMHELGHSFGLYHLSCNVQGSGGAPSGACSGPNYQDCQASCTRPTTCTLDIGCTASNDPLCFSDPKSNIQDFMSYCFYETSAPHYGTAGYDYIRNDPFFVQMRGACIAS